MRARACVRPVPIPSLPGVGSKFSNVLTSRVQAHACGMSPVERPRRSEADGQGAASKRQSSVTSTPLPPPVPPSLLCVCVASPRRRLQLSTPLSLPVDRRTKSRDGAQPHVRPAIPGGTVPRPSVCGEHQGWVRGWVQWERYLSDILIVSAASALVDASAVLSSVSVALLSAYTAVAPLDCLTTRSCAFSSHPPALIFRAIAALMNGRT